MYEPYQQIYISKLINIDNTLTCKFHSSKDNFYKSEECKLHKSINFLNID